MLRLGGAITAAAILWIAFFSGAGRLGLIGPDEPRYAAVARAMADSGDWVTPRLNGEPWFEKPILYYWGAALSFRIFGVSEAAARLPSALAATAATLALAVLCAGLYGASAGYALLLILPTSLATIAFARAASTDMVFAGTLTLAFVAAAKLIARRSAAYLVAWGAFLGLALLAKGPAALVLAGGSVALWTILTRAWRLAVTLAHPIAAATLVAVAGPWYVLCSMRNPDFIRVFIIEHNVARYLTPVFAHEQPVGYFAVVLVAGLLPWTPLLVPAVQDVWTSATSRERDPIALLAACWALVPLLFFSLSKSKLPGYVLPAFPPIAFLIARAVSCPTAAPTRAAHMLVATGLTMVMVAMAAPTVVPLLVPGNSMGILNSAGSLWGWAGMLGAAGIGVTVVAWFGRPWIAFTLTGVTIALLFLAINTRIVPSIDAQLTPRTAAAVAERARHERPLYLHELDRSWAFGLSYYAGRQLPAWNGDTDGLVVTSKAGMRTLISRRYDVTVVERVSDEAILVTVARPG